MRDKVYMVNGGRIQINHVNNATNSYSLGLDIHIINTVLQEKPEVDFFEVHTENFIPEGGASLDFLEKISALYPLSFHCFGLSLGSASGINKTRLKNIKKLFEHFKPILFSKHLSWSNFSSADTSNDLLPMP